MKTILSFAFLLFAFANLTAQSNINQSLSVNADGSAPNASAQLDVSATDKGMLVPRMTSAQRNTIATPATGLLVFDTDEGDFWFYTGAVWQNLSTQKVLADADNDTKIQVEELPDEDIIRFDLGGVEKMFLVKNTNGAARLELPDDERTTIIGQEAGMNNNPSPGVGGYHNTFLGYRSGNANTLGNSNTFLGSQSGRSNTTGASNTASGYAALFTNDAGTLNTAHGYRALFSNLTGSVNVASGDEALFLNATGAGNTAAGSKALYSNATGNSNTAIGRQALFSNTTGNASVAIGIRALYNNTDRSHLVAVGDSALFNNGTGATVTNDALFNTAIGSKALYSNTTGRANTANGYQALYSNTTGNTNTANGYQALYSNITGFWNTATGYNALYSNSSGYENTANGLSALYANATGSCNTATGYSALSGNTNGDHNTTQGFRAGQHGNSNHQCVVIGSLSDVGDFTNSYTNAIAIGYDVNTAANNFARIGNASVTSIGGQVAWSNYSDGRFKRNVREDVAGLEFITRLRPVTYQWDIHALNDFMLTSDDSTEWESKYDIEKIRFSGFVAQEVEQAAQAVGFDFSGVDKPQNEFTAYALRYAEFVVPLVKAVQEQQAEIENLRLEIEKLKGVQVENDAQRSQLDDLSRELGKITAALAGAGISVEK